MHDTLQNFDALEAEYRHRHYVVVKGFYPAALVQDYLGFLQEAVQLEVVPALASLGLSLETPDLAAQISTRIANDPNFDPAVKHLLMGHFPLHIRLSERIHHIARHLGNSPLLHRLLGSNTLYMHMPPMMRYVPPHYTPSAVPPHQDSSYNPHMTDFVTVWTPLVPIDLQCGGMIMYEDSHHTTLPTDTSESGWLAPVSIEGYQQTQLTGLVPGDAVLLSPHIIHASAPNISDRIRFSMDLRIFGATGRSTKHHMNLDTLEVIAA